MNHLDTIVRFLGGLGFTVIRQAKPNPSGFINGIYCHGTTMFVDPDRMKTAGDLLHEAGHLAIVPSPFRNKISGDLTLSLLPHMDRYFDEHDPLEAEMQGDMVFRGHPYPVSAGK